MENLDSLVEKVYLHFKDKKNKSYPMLSEKGEIKEALEELISSPDSFYFIDEIDSEIQGICGYYIIEKEKYLQTTIFASFNYNKNFIKNVLDYFREKYPDYIINIGVEAENTLIIDELKSKGYRIIDDLYSTTINPYLSNGKKYSNVLEISLDDWDNFEKIHQHNFGEGYWNFNRIKDSFKYWKIYSIKDNIKIKAYTFVKLNSKNKSCEIFGIYGEIDNRIRLIEHVLASTKDKELLYYFIEDEKEMEKCKELGFEIHGHYQGWEYKV